MAPIIGRDTAAAAAAAAPGLSTAAIAGIAVAGSVLLCAILVVGIVVIIRSRHRRALADLEHDAVARRLEILETQRTSVPPPEETSRKVFSLPRRAKLTGWGKLSSNENLRGDYEKNDGQQSAQANMKRKSDAVKTAEDALWSTMDEQAAADHAIPMKRFRPSHLSAIIESPRSHTGSPKPVSEMDFTEAFPQTLAESLSRTPSPLIQHTPPLIQYTPPLTQQTPELEADDVIKERQRQHHLSLASDIWQTLELNPSSVFARHSHIIRNAKRISLEPADRSVSDTALISPALSGSTQIGSRLSGKFDSRRASRSLSMQSLPGGTGPSIPLPPLPDSAERPRRASIGCSPRTSISSANSASSSILALAPVSGNAVQDFSRRHPEMGLGLQIRQDDNEDFKDTLLERQEAPEPDATVPTLPLPRRVSAPPRSMKEHSPFSIPRPDAGATARLSSRVIHRPFDGMVKIHDSGPPARSWINRASAEPHGRLGHHARQTSAKHAVSASGSPISYKEPSLIPALPTRSPARLESIQGQPAGRPMSKRALERNSLASDRSVNAARSRHRRQNSSRGSNSTNAYGPSGSYTNLTKIQEESMAAASHVDRITLENVDSQSPVEIPEPGTLYPIPPSGAPSRQVSIGAASAYSSYSEAPSFPEGDLNGARNSQFRSTSGAGTRSPIYIDPPGADLTPASPNRVNFANEYGSFSPYEEVEFSFDEPTGSGRASPAFKYALSDSPSPAAETIIAPSRVSSLGAEKNLSLINSQPNPFVSAPRLPPPKSPTIPQPHRPSGSQLSMVQPEVIRSVAALRRLTSDSMNDTPDPAAPLPRYPFQRSITNSSLAYNLSAWNLLPDAEFGGKENLDLGLMSKQNAQWAKRGAEPLPNGPDETMFSYRPGGNNGPVDAGLSSPGSKTKRDSLIHSTPGSLYDADGFLRV